MVGGRDDGYDGHHVGEGGGEGDGEGVVVRVVMLVSVVKDGDIALADNAMNLRRRVMGQ